MRDIAVVLAIVLAIGLTFPYPFVGILTWAWFTLMNPHMEAYGFARTAPLNLSLAVVTVLAWLFSRERKMPPASFITWAIVAFLIWMTITSVFAMDPAFSWPLWDRTWKIFALGLLIAATATNKTRIHALMWIIVASLCYYGVKGGLFTILTGGHYHVIGPRGTVIGDNNQLALALLMVLPLANYLRAQSANRTIRTILLAAMVLTVISVMGSYSRGGILGLGVLAIFAWFRVRGKFIYLVVAAIVFIPMLYFMPEHFFHRLDTLQQITADASFMGRVHAWHVAFMAAVDRFPFGAGFSGLQRPAIFHLYMPGEEAHAAHSIFFQVLGDHGFIGLAIYLAIIIATFIKCFHILRKSKGIPELRWANDLAGMIQLTVIVFCVGGAALSMAYYDLFVICTTVLLPLSEIVKGATQTKNAANKKGQYAFAGEGGYEGGYG